MMTAPMEDTAMEEELSSEVRHLILLCWKCSNGNTISRPPVELVGRLLTTICERFVRYVVVNEICEDCTAMREGGAFVDECAMCGESVEDSLKGQR